MIVFINGEAVAFSKDMTFSNEKVIEPMHKKWSTTHKKWKLSWSVDSYEGEIKILNELNRDHNSICELQTWARISRIAIFGIHKYFPVFSIIPGNYKIDVESLIKMNNG